MKDLNKINKRHFTNTSDMVAMASQDAPNANYRSSRSLTQENWYGTPNFEAAVALTETGWPDRPVLDGIARDIQASSDHNIQLTRNAVTGSYVDIGAFVTGNPENMIEFTEMPSPKVFRLGVNIWHNCGVPDYVFANIGAIAMALSDTITKSGNALEIVALGGGEEGATFGFMQSVVVKDADRILDEDKMAFWLCHNSVLRRIMFGVCEVETNDGDPGNFGLIVGNGYSTPYANNEAGNKFIRSYGESIGCDYTLTGAPRDLGQAVRIYNEALEAMTGNEEQ